MSRDVVYFLDVPVTDRDGEGRTIQPHEGTGDMRIYRRKGTITSVVTEGTIYKNADNFETLDRAERACNDWKSMGWTGAPSSPARVFARALEQKVEANEVPHPAQVRPEREVVDPRRVTWLWIESLVGANQVITEPVYHYDINEAFYSSVAKGLPLHFVPYREGDDRWVGEVEIKDSDRPLPAPWELQETAFLTAADVRYWGMDVEVRRALTYEDHRVDLSPVFELVGNHFGPWTAKRARQQSWGCFAQSSKSVKQEIYRDGQMETSSPLVDRWSCAPWALIVTRRIMRQVDAAVREGDGISLFVDSILSRRPISRVGDEAGQWGKEGHYENGIYLKAPGLWDTRPRSTTYPSEQWKKHAGIGTRPHQETRGEKAEEIDVDQIEWEREYEEYKQEHTDAADLAAQTDAPF